MKKTIPTSSPKWFERAARIWVAAARSILAVAGILLAGAVSPAHAGLKDYAAAVYTPIGSCAQGGLINADADGGNYNATLAEQFNLIGCENDLKMDSIWTNWNASTDSPMLNPGGADAVANFARAHGMHMRGHVLFYRSDVPKFLRLNNTNVASPYTDAQIAHMCQVYVQTVMHRYQDVIKQWDVCNEAFDDNGKLRGLTNTNADFWYAHLGGTNYFKTIFNWAYAAQPDCTLYYNDYNTEYPGPKFDGMMTYINSIKNTVPIGGIGFQCHEHITSPNNILSSANTAAVDAAGLAWEVTELDVYIPTSSPTNPPTSDQRTTQNNIFAHIANLCLNDVNCQGLMLWGFTDAHSWLSPDKFGCIFDADYGPQTGFYAINWQYLYAPNALPQNTSMAIVNMNSGMAAEVEGWSSQPGGNVDQYYNYKNPNQLWQLVCVDYGFYKIVNNYSHLVMGIQGSSALGANIDQETYNGGDDQQWSIQYINPYDSGIFVIRNKMSGQCLDVYGGSKSLNGNIIQYNYHGGANQQWNLQF